jgi:hypothetical protein
LILLNEYADRFAPQVAAGRGATPWRIRVKGLPAGFSPRR